MLLSPPRRPGWTPLAGRSWLFNGASFDDDRGTSQEVCDLSSRPPQLPSFISVQENIVSTRLAGTLRGLHFQTSPCAQAKLVTVMRGSAQFFWVSNSEDTQLREVNSIILKADAASLFTPSDCAHGMLSLEDDTQFLLRMSAPISMAHRGEVSMLGKSLSFNFAGQFRGDLLSERDRHAPEWSMRRRT